MSEFRIGSVPYLNAAPLTFGLEADCHFLPPSQLALELHAGRLDAALVSVTEVLLHPGYDILDGCAIASDGEVYSVFLAHQQPLEEMETVHLDPASCTSVNLVRILLAARGIHPRFLPLEGYEPATIPANVVLIGNPAIEFRRGIGSHRIWDLGAAWKEWTGLPFVYAVWALARNRDTASLRRRLSSAAREGIAALRDIVATHHAFDQAFRRKYLGGYIRYGLGPAEKCGLERFATELGRQTARQIYRANFIRGD